MPAPEPALETGCVRADWGAPAPVQALTTLRGGGASRGAFASFNLGQHVGDDPGAVAANRARLVAGLGLAREPAWPRQVHGTRVLHARDCARGAEADGVWSDRAGEPCAVLSADCLPVFFAAADGSCVGLAHAGWRGLAAGVLGALLEALPAPPGEVLAHLGPAISGPAYEVGAEVREAFACVPASAFRPGRPGRWHADLYALARHQLAALGVRAVSGAVDCTSRQPGRFFSHRRDGPTGRMASLIWLD